MVIRQRCGLSPSSADWYHQFIPNPWRASSRLRARLSFRYTQVPTSGAHDAQPQLNFNGTATNLRPVSKLRPRAWLSGHAVHASALMRLNELGLLPQAKRISSASGGLIATGSCVWPKLKLDGFQNFKQTFVPPILTFARQKVDVVDALTRSIRPARFSAIPPGAICRNTARCDSRLEGFNLQAYPGRNPLE